MRIYELSLKNFRNYGKQTVQFSEGVNVLCGDNANGKTNVLEAVYIFGYGKSHRARSDAEMINFASDFAKISISFESRGRNFKSVINLSRDGKKTIFVNNVPIKRLSKLLTYLHVVLFSPDDLSLIKGSPSLRRSYIDSALCRIYPSYIAALRQFQKAAAQKNCLLKELKKTGKTSDSYLSVWNDAIAEASEKIIGYRSEFVSEINSLSAKIQKDISSEMLVTTYEPNLSCTEKDDIFEFLESKQGPEITAGAMRWGIQRDDMSVSINGSDARVYASQGQQRTAALSYKIAEADYIFSKTGEYPVLLLDDIMSELDLSRRMYLWERISGKQVMITCTDTDFFESKNGTRLFEVKNNAVTPINSMYDGRQSDVSSSGK